jgi:hypothetical protein
LSHLTNTCFLSVFTDQQHGEATGTHASLCIHWNKPANHKTTATYNCNKSWGGQQHTREVPSRVTKSKGQQKKGGDPKKKKT